MMGLEIGSRDQLQSRCETIPNTGLAPFSILFAGDLHLSRWTRPVVRQIVHSVEQAQPDLILLGGDLVDTTAGLTQLAECILHLSAIAPVWAISGNHDVALNVEAVQLAVEVGGGFWLDNRSISPIPGLSIDGICRPVGPVKDGFSILCAHNPIIFPQAVSAGYDLVLAGHLHGGQIVLGRVGERLYPGAFGYRWNGDKFRQGTTTLIVSRGVNDTLPIRWNCPREVVLCKLC